MARFLRSYGQIKNNNDAGELKWISNHIQTILEIFGKLKQPQQ